MHRSIPLAFAVVALAGCDHEGRGPTTVNLAPVAAISSGPAPSGEGRDRLSCSCGVADFESDGPPTERCTLVFGADGVATLTSVTATPSFSARWTPIVQRGKQERVHYAFEGAFDFTCREPWCGHQELSVLEIGDRDYRVTVARSDDGPPSHVLSVTCTPASR